MAIIKWHPLNELEDIFEDFGNRHLWHDLAADVYEDNGNIVVEMHVPGIKLEDITIEVDENVLRVAGHRQEAEEKKDKNFYRKEIRRGSFERVISLPAAVDSAHANAEIKNGTLKVTLPKEKGKKPSKINIAQK